MDYKYIFLENYPSPNCKFCGTKTAIAVLNKIYKQGMSISSEDIVPVCGSCRQIYYPYPCDT